MSGAALLLAFALAVGLGSCAPEPVADRRATAEEWRAVEAAKRALDAARGSDGAREEVERLADELSRRLVAFLNADPPREGEPLSPRQRQAIRWKSDEDLRVARGYVEKAGDHRRAIEILEAALALDPNNGALRAALRSIRTSRFVTRERFDKVEMGMTDAEVEALLGAPNPHDVRELPDLGPQAGVVGWFYPKDDAGAAAAVWFERRAGGRLEVYRTDFAAVRPGGENPSPADSNPAASDPAPSRPPGLTPPAGP